MRTFGRRAASTRWCAGAKRSPPMRFAPYFFWLCVGFEALACGSSSSTTAAIVRPELIQVLPEDFLGAHRCVEGPGGPGEVRSYVAELYDLPTDVDGGTAVKVLTSPPTSCQRPTTFSASNATDNRVIAGHRYRIGIKAYQELEPGSEVLEPPPPATFEADCEDYPASPGAGGGGGAGGGAGEPGLVSYAAITRTAHNCSSLKPPPN